MAAELPDNISVRRWFAFYAAMLLACALVLALLISRSQWTWEAWRSDFSNTLSGSSTTIKLLVFAIYISLCCTFLPMPTGWVVAAVATQEAAIAPNVWATTLIVAVIGATASTVANLNDYHLFTWMLRHHRIAKVRQTRTYAVAARWFARAPFAILTLFNFIPIPVDIIRMLATTYRYPRWPFAASSFLGRFVRYAVIAMVTYLLGEAGWIAVVALLALAIVLGAWRILPMMLRRLRNRTKKQTAEATEST